jgi:hypothetical protein
LLISYRSKGLDWWHRSCNDLTTAELMAGKS